MGYEDNRASAESLFSTFVLLFPKSVHGWKYEAIVIGANSLDKTHGEHCAATWDASIDFLPSALIVNGGLLLYLLQ
jgi:hypothetical protein